MDGKIRTPQLSPSFELIQALKAQKDQNVSRGLLDPNRIIANLVDLLNTFLPDARQLGLSYS